jgi:chondroitin-sulfate-ABC endolyase/exolyase
MRKTIFAFLLFCFVTSVVAEKYYSFEDIVPAEWNSVTNGTLGISLDHFKEGQNSLKWNWNAGSVITVNNPDTLNVNSKNSNGAIWAWVYNATPRTDSLRFNFSNAAGKVLAGFNFRLNFSGWRFMWVCFGRDLKYSYTTGNELTKMSIVAPPTGSGNLYFDMVETVPTSSINWHRYSDFQYNVLETGAELRNKAYNQTVDISNVNLNDTVVANTIKERVFTWFTGNTAYSTDPVYTSRYNALLGRINMYKNSSWSYNQTLLLTRQADNTIHAFNKADGAGVGLHGDMIGYKLMFNDINAFLTELGQDVAINNASDKVQLQRTIDFLDWMYDQGYAEGSGLGTGLTQLRCSGFPFAFFLIHKYITDDVQYERYMKAIRWIVADTYANPGASADEIRGSTLSKLIYALCIKDPVKRVAELQSFKKHLENAVAIAPGYFGLVKPDYSVYHHNMGYYSEYGDDAIHQSAMVMYFLRETKYALSPTTYTNIKKATLNIAEVSSNYIVPASVSGRFPGNGKNVTDLLQAIAYIGLSSTTLDDEVVNIFNRLYSPSNTDVASLIGGSGVGIQYTLGPGGAVALIDYKKKITGIAAKPALFTKYLPYSGLFAANKNDWAISIKGFSKYIIDFECINNEGRYLRYLSYGHMQIMSAARQLNNYTYDKSFDWIHFPGTTTINWPLSKIDTRGAGNNSKERNFHDETFLGGVTMNENMGMFSMNMHDNVFNNTFRARKSVFYFGNMLYCMGSGIANNDAANATHTTLFQNLSGTSLLVNNAAVTSSYSQPTTAVQIVKNSWGNNYIVFPGTSTLSVQKRNQTGFNPSGVATPTTSYEIAWLDHGVKPTNAKYNYAMLLQNEIAMTNALTSTTNPAIRVLRQETDAHIIQNTLSNTYAYSFFQALSNINTLYGGIVNSVSKPCVIMATTNSNGSVDLSFSNPDLNRPAYSEATANTAGAAVLTTITLTGNYILSNAPAEVTLANQTNGTCIISFNALNGANYKATITDINSGIAEVEFSNAVKIYPNPATDILNIEIGAELNANSISIFTPIGQQLMNKQVEKGTNHQVIDINGLMKGVYFMNISSDKLSATKLFVKK